MPFYALCAELLENRSSEPEAAQREKPGKKLMSQSIQGAESGNLRCRFRGQESLPAWGIPHGLGRVLRDERLSCDWISGGDGSSRVLLWAIAQIPGNSWDFCCLRNEMIGNSLTHWKCSLGWYWRVVYRFLRAQRNSEAGWYAAGRSAMKEAPLGAISAGWQCGVWQLHVPSGKLARLKTNLGGQRFFFQLKPKAGARPHAFIILCNYNL